MRYLEIFCGIFRSIVFENILKDVKVMLCDICGKVIEENKFVYNLFVYWRGGGIMSRFG